VSGLGKRFDWVYGAYGVAGTFNLTSADSFGLNVRNPNFIKATEFVKQIIDAKVVDPDWPTLKKDEYRARWKQGKCGIMNENFAALSTQANYSDFDKNFPDGEWVVLPPPAVLSRLAEAVTKVQEPASGLWYQVLDQGSRAGNYLEASASCMFVYTLAKAVRQGYLPGDYLAVARRGYRGVLDELVRVDVRGQVNLEGTCSVAGLGGEPYRDGAYDYYIGEPIATNDLKGVGAFILAAVEMEGRLNEERVAA
jgi:hypothetical protein